MPAYDLFGEPASPATLTADTASYVLAVQFSIASLLPGQVATLTRIKWFSPPGAGILPNAIDLWQVSGASLVATQAASWDGAVGSGWVHAPFTSPPVLTPGVAYKAAIFKNDGSVNTFYGSTPNYWSSGPGSGGITNGPLSAPNNAGGDGGQSTFNNSNLNAYPATSFNATNYWLDLEVTVTGGLAAAAQPGDYGRSAIRRELIWA